MQSQFWPVSSPVSGSWRGAGFFDPFSRLIRECRIEGGPLPLVWTVASLPWPPVSTLISPNGNMIATVPNRSGAEVGIYLLDYDRTTRRAGNLRLFYKAPVRYSLFAFLPDGTGFLFSAHLGLHDEIRLLGLDGTLRWKRPGGIGGGDCLPAVTEDGSRLYWNRGEHSLDLKTGERRDRVPDVVE
jgi:hypothetical protein